MAVSISLKGEKGHRQAVKTIDINNISYNAIKNMLTTGQNMTEDVVEPLINDVYEIFGGNCYSTTIILAVKSLMSEIVRGLEVRKCLSVKDDKAFYDITESIFPTMCYVKDEDGAAFDELRFFETDAEQIISEIGDCLNERTNHLFSKFLRKAVSECSEPAGEIALRILLHISIGDSSMEDPENNVEIN